VSKGEARGYPHRQQTTSHNTFPTGSPAVHECATSPIPIGAADYPLPERSGVDKLEGGGCKPIVEVGEPIQLTLELSQQLILPMHQNYAQLRNRQAEPSTEAHRKQGPVQDRGQFSCNMMTFRGRQSRKQVYVQ
jgi:hypothetical protein